MEIDIPNETLTLLIRASEVLGKDEASTIHLALEILLEKKDPVRKADRAMKKSAGVVSTPDVSAPASTPDVSAPASTPDVSAPASTPDVSAQAKIFTAARLANNVPFNAATYHAVNARDRGQCQQILPSGEKCCDTKWPEIHHIIERALGGSNDPSNLITLCSAHHRIHHRRTSWVRSPQVAYSA